MRVDIKGNNPVASEDVKRVIDKLNSEFEDLGIKVKNLTMYVRFVDSKGKTVEPVGDAGSELRYTFTFTDAVNAKSKVSDGSESKKSSSKRKKCNSNKVK